MTEAESEALVEELASIVHGALSKANVMAYLDMPLETAGDVARAILPIIERIRREGIEEAAKVKATLAKLTEGWANALELDLIPPQHRNTAQILADEGRAALGALAEKQP